MDFFIPERGREIASRVRSFVDEEVVPLERVVFARGFGAVSLRAGLGRSRKRACIVLQVTSTTT